MVAVLGAILSGGRSTRMGRDKAEIMLGGRTMLEMVGRALGAVVGRVVVMGSGYPGWTCWPDAFHVEGPLAGVATALGRAEHDQVLAVAVDQPLVRSETLRGLIGMASDLPVVPVDSEGVRQVTCALYPTVVAREAVEEAEANGSIQSLLDRVSFLPVTPDVWQSWGEDGRSWLSLDTPEALEEAERLIAEA